MSGFNVAALRGARKGEGGVSLPPRGQTAVKEDAARNRLEDRLGGRGHAQEFLHRRAVAVDRGDQRARHGGTRAVLRETMPALNGNLDARLL